MANEFNENVPEIWKDNYLGENSDISLLKIVGTFVDKLPGMAAIDIGNCLIHLMKFCQSGGPRELQKATEYLNHCNNYYYGINPNWNSSEWKGEN